MEKIVEISDAVIKKLRLTFFVATKAQTTFGPDSYTLKLGKLKFARSHISHLNPGLLLASQDPVAAEAGAIALLKCLRKQLLFKVRLYERLVLFSSYKTGELDKLNIPDHPYIVHAINMGIGDLPIRIQYDNVPNEIQREFNNLLDVLPD